MHPVKLIERAASTAAHTLRHPLSSAAYSVGIARGLVGAALHGATTTGHDPEAGPRPVPTQRSTAPAATPAPAEAVIEPPEPPPPGEQFATEPKAVSRESAHGGRAATDAEIDAWIDEAMARGEDVDVETPVGTTGADVGHNPDTAEADLQQPDTEPLLDPGTAKAIRSESEMMRKDAERDPD